MSKHAAVEWALERDNGLNNQGIVAMALVTLLLFGLGASVTLLPLRRRPILYVALSSVLTLVSFFIVSYYKVGYFDPFLLAIFPHLLFIGAAFSFVLYGSIRVAKLYREHRD